MTVRFEIFWVLQDEFSYHFRCKDFQQNLDNSNTSISNLVSLRFMWINRNTYNAFSNNDKQLLLASVCTGERALVYRLSEVVFKWLWVRIPAQYSWLIRFVKFYRLKRPKRSGMVDVYQVIVGLLFHFWTAQPSHWLGRRLWTNYSQYIQRRCALIYVSLLVRNTLRWT